MIANPDPLNEVYRSPDRRDHFLIAMERADHPGTWAFEVLRMIPGQMSERWTYERWTMRRFEGLEAVEGLQGVTIRRQAELVWNLVQDRYRGRGKSQRVIMVPPATEQFPLCRFCGERLREAERDGHLYVLDCVCGARIRYIFRALPPLEGWGSLSVERYPDDERLGFPRRQQSILLQAATSPVYEQLSLL